MHLLRFKKNTGQLQVFQRKGIVKMRIQRLFFPVWEKKWLAIIPYGGMDGSVAYLQINV